MIDLNAPYEIPETVIHAVIDGAVSMINLNTKTSYVLNASGTAIWGWMQQGASVKTILKTITGSGTTDIHDTATQVMSFLDELVKEGLIARSDAPPAQIPLSFASTDYPTDSPPSVRVWDGVVRRHAAVERHLHS